MSIINMRLFLEKRRIDMLENKLFEYMNYTTILRNHSFNCIECTCDDFDDIIKYLNKRIKEIRLKLIETKDRIAYLLSKVDQRSNNITN